MGDAISFGTKVWSLAPIEKYLNVYIVFLSLHYRPFREFLQLFIFNFLISSGEFDMRVKSCLAEAENSKPIQLTDEHGCVLRPKMISKLMKIAGADSRASVITYAFFHAFKFPDSMSVHIKCKVREGVKKRLKVTNRSVNGGGGSIRNLRREKDTGCSETEKYVF